LDRSKEQWRENLGGEEEYHPTGYCPFNFEPDPDKRIFRAHPYGVIRCPSQNIIFANEKITM
jgi:hypothetical protein